MTARALADVPFMQIPRILSCLHTICNSCLDDQFQRSDKHEISCPICHSSQPCDGVLSLPIDYRILKSITQDDRIATSLISFCGNCYEDVPSYSWCSICGSALCEVHHREHRVSIDTSKHEVATLKDLELRGISIVPSVPPLCCTQVLQQDCTAYCKPCNCTVSAQATVNFHKSHDVFPINEVYRLNVQPALRAIHDHCEQRQSTLQQTVLQLERNILELNRNSAAALRDVSSQFEKILRRVEARRDHLTSRLRDLTELKHRQLEDQLESLKQLLDDHQRESEVVLSALAGSDPVQEAYAVAAWRSIECFEQSAVRRFHATDLTPRADPSIWVQFDYNDAVLFRSKLHSYGSIHSSTLDNELVNDGRDTVPVKDMAEEDSSQNISSIRPPGDVCFTVKTRCRVFLKFIIHSKIFF